MPDKGRFFGELARALKPGGRLLVAEPVVHVGAKLFENELDVAAGAGLWLKRVWAARLAAALAIATLFVFAASKCSTRT